MVGALAFVGVLLVWSWTLGEWRRNQLQTESDVAKRVRRGKTRERLARMDHSGHTEHDAMPSGDEAGMHEGHDMSSMHGMAMYFTATTSVTVWFKSWTTGSNVAYAFALIGIFVMCLVHEALTTARLTYKVYTHTKGPDDFPSRYPPVLRPLATSTALRVATDTILYAANLVTSYLLMLLVMTYNVGVFFVVIGGLAIGRLIFYKQRVVDYQLLSGNSGVTNGEVDHSDLCCPTS